jgi:hypothetical protein
LSCPWHGKIIRPLFVLPKAGASETGFSMAGVPFTAKYDGVSRVEVHALSPEAHGAGQPRAK